MYSRLPSVASVEALSFVSVRACSASLAAKPRRKAPWRRADVPSWTTLSHSDKGGIAISFFIATHHVPSMIATIPDIVEPSSVDKALGRHGYQHRQGDQTPKEGGNIPSIGPHSRLLLIHLILKVVRVCHLSTVRTQARLFRSSQQAACGGEDIQIETSCDSGKLLKPAKCHP